MVLELVEKITQKSKTYIYRKSHPRKAPEAEAQPPPPPQEPERKEPKKRGPKPKKKGKKGKFTEISHIFLQDENEPKKKRGRKPKTTEEAPTPAPAPVAEPVVATPAVTVESDELIKAKSRFSETISDMSEEEIKQLSSFISTTLQGENYKDIFEKGAKKVRKVCF